MKRTRLIYLAHTQPGFEEIAAQEIAEYEGASVRETLIVPDKNGMVLFDYSNDARELFDLRMIEDLFVVVAELHNLPPVYAGLRELQAAIARAPAFEPALALSRQLAPGRGGHGKVRYRVVARQVGQASFRRIDAQQAVEKAIAARPEHRWRLEEEGALEFWLTLFPGSALLALRLSDERMRHRTYKIEHLPASLRPSAAAALVYLTRPADDDVFLDPMCGAGTLLIERGNAGRYQLLLGGDEDEKALAMGRKNIGTRYQPIELHEWDARHLPLDAGSISAVAVNLPFGRQIGSPEENRTLYPAFLREMARVLRPGARLVALTGDVRTFGDALGRAKGFRRIEAYPVRLLGYPARVFVLEAV